MVYSTNISQMVLGPWLTFTFRKRSAPATPKVCTMPDVVGGKTLKRFSRHCHEHPCPDLSCPNSPPISGIFPETLWLLATHFPNSAFSPQCAHLSWQIHFIWLNSDQIPNLRQKIVLWCDSNDRKGLVSRSLSSNYSTMISYYHHLLCYHHH